MFTSFSTVSYGVSADTTAIDVVGNNLANLNTAGFKASTVAFHDLLSQSIGSGSTQVGFGVGTPVTLRHFSQGAIQSTAGPPDAAIQGEGFFVVKTPSRATASPRSRNFYGKSTGELGNPTKQVM